MGTLPDGIRADAVQMPGTGAQPGRAEEVAFQEQTDEPGRKHHRPVGEHVRLGELPADQGSYQTAPAAGPRWLPAVLRRGDGRQDQRDQGGAHAAVRSGDDFGNRPRLHRLPMVSRTDAGGSVLRDTDEGEGRLRGAGRIAGSAKQQRGARPDICFPRLRREGEEPVLFRRVEIWDAEKQEALVFLSNLLAFGATTIAAIYKDRWQVELFFEALKQTLKIKTFVGTSANAVRTQVWTALIAMLVLKYLQLKSKFSWSLSTLAALLRQQLFFYRDLWVWLDDPFQAPPALVGVHDDAQQLEITW